MDGTGKCGSTVHSGIVQRLYTHKCNPLVVEGKGLGALHGKNAVRTLSYHSMVALAL
jgi:hypothetical protein